MAATDTDTAEIPSPGIQAPGRRHQTEALPDEDAQDQQDAAVNGSPDTDAPSRQKHRQVSIRMCECVRKPTYAHEREPSKEQRGQLLAQVTGLFRTYRSTTLEKTGCHAT